MPIKIPDKLPAGDVLKSENIFVMNEDRAYHQQIRPLRIAICNLMPTKQKTEVQLLRLLSNSPLQVSVKLIHMESHISKNTASAYLNAFYHTFNDIRYEKLDGMIITGAPIETIPFENVFYWKELKEIMEWTKTNVTSTLHICWGAQAALYYHYGIPKYPLEQKMFGVFPHTVNRQSVNLLKGFDNVFTVPHSRHTTIKRADVQKVMGLDILAESEEAGIYLIASKDGKQIFATGHSEYDPTSLADEYFRDVNKGMDIAVPKYYFPEDDPTKPPLVTWRAHGSLLFSNWLNYYVYQVTPYEWK